MRVEDDGWRRRGDTDHLCLFLGPRSSFAIDAREFAGSAEVAGGCAYFFLRHLNYKEGEPLGTIAHRCVQVQLPGRHHHVCRRAAHFNSHLVHASAEDVSSATTRPRSMVQ
ncbi:hypothetical protein C2845_PM01G13000 [Panicum miliaceum]|uniref:Uncharacterized protein n=1 Tax=Panicum miliaceum TaxID=4540 RepID=A0A3L6TW42_PANMI|nr:hypothetical protein C2845_PM01G13000 [Panicum miliaceum]